jgi:hypothetical protein
MELSLPSAAQPVPPVFSRLDDIRKRTDFVDPYVIAPLSSIRHFKENGMLSILRQICKSGWKSTSDRITVVELKDNPYGSDASSSLQYKRVKEPVYGCVDGWHRLKAITTLLERKADTPLGQTRGALEHNTTCLDTPLLFKNWPVDETTGIVSKIEVTVLEGEFAESELILFAMHLNSTAGFAVVSTTYLDMLAAGRRFLEAITAEFLAKVAGGQCDSVFAPQTWFVTEMTCVYATEYEDANMDFKIIRLLNTNTGLMELLQDHAVRYPMATINAIRRETLQHLVSLIPVDEPDAAETVTWTVSAFIQVQHKWGETVQKQRASRQIPNTPVYTPSGGPSRNGVFKAVLSLLKHLYILHKPQPSEPPSYAGSTQQRRLEMSAAVTQIVNTFVEFKTIKLLNENLPKVKDCFSNYEPPKPRTPPVSPRTAERILAEEADEDVRPLPGSPSFIPSPIRHDDGDLETSEQQEDEAVSALPNLSQQDSVAGMGEQAPIETTQRASTPEAGPLVQTTGGSGPAEGQGYVPPRDHSRIIGTQQAAEDEVMTPHRQQAHAQMSDAEITPVESASTRTALAAGVGKRHQNWPPPRGMEPPRTRSRTMDEEEALQARQATITALMLKEIETTAAPFKNRATSVGLASQQHTASAHTPASDASGVQRAPRKQQRTPRQGGAKSPFDDDIEPPEGSLRETFMRNASTAENAQMLQSIYVPAFFGGAELVRGFFAARGEPGRPEQCLADIRNWISSPGDATTRALRTLAHQGIADSGFVILDSLVPELSGAAGSDTLRQCVDGVLGHFRDCFSAIGTSTCCKNTTGAVEAWKAIRNEPSSRTKSLRFQSPREAITQHLEQLHPEIFAQKLIVDIFIACIVEILVHPGGHGEYSMPNSGSRLLLTAPGCRAKCMQRDFDDRLDNDVPLPVDDPSYFAIVTGADAAPLLVIPGSHGLVARIEHLLTRGSPKDRAAIEADGIGNMAIKKTVLIKPYSVFIGRGDLVHAGAGRSPTEKGPAVRFHTYVMRKGKDKIEDHLFEYEF